eukprot:gene12979-3744_t
MKIVNTTTPMNSTLKGNIRGGDERYQWNPSIIVWLCFGIIGLWLNAVEFVSITCNRRKMTAFYLTLVSLGFADLLACASYVFYGGTFLATYSSSATIHPVFNTVRVVSQKLIFGFLAISCIHIVFIAVQRLCAVRFPLSFSRVFSTAKCHVCIAIAWCVGLTYAVLNVYSERVGIVSCYQLLVFGVMLIVMYCVIICQATFRSPVLRTNSTASMKQSKRVLIHSICVTIIFIACNFPYAINFLFFASNRSPLRYFYGLLALRAILDPMLYFFIHRCKSVSVAVTSQ